MSKLSSQQLDLQIQLSLVAKIRQAAQRYQAEPVEPGSTALQSYVAALETLADHIETRCRGSRLAQEIAFPANRLDANPVTLPVRKSKDGRRLLQFPSVTASSGSPWPAA